jgi:hypothetical protein
MEAYIGGVLVPNGEGCYIKFSGDDGTTICIKQIASISTEVPKSKTGQALWIGTGDMTISLEGSPLTGIVYLDAKGTLKKASSGSVISISLSGKIRGGSHGSYVSGGSFKTTLTPE